MSLLGNLYGVSTPPPQYDELEAALQEAYEAGISDGYQTALNEIGDTNRGMKAIDALIDRTKGRIDNFDFTVKPKYIPNAKLGLGANLINANKDIQAQTMAKQKEHQNLLNKLTKFQNYKMNAQLKNDDRERFSKLPPKLQAMLAARRK